MINGVPGTWPGLVDLGAGLQRGRPVLGEGLPAVIEESLEGDATPPDRYASTLLGLVIQHAWKDQLVEAVVFAIAFSNLAANLNSPGPGTRLRRRGRRRDVRGARRGRVGVARCGAETCRGR
jgi:hypothetical protein